MRFFTRIANTDLADLAGRLAERSVHVLDVRQPNEWRHSHIRGSQNLPLMQLKTHLETLPRGKTIVAICASGHRSATAARRLQRAGYQVENQCAPGHAQDSQSKKEGMRDEDAPRTIRLRLTALNRVEKLFVNGDRHSDRVAAQSEKRLAPSTRNRDNDSSMSAVATAPQG